jgi:hypothetical protein
MFSSLLQNLFLGSTAGHKIAVNTNVPATQHFCHSVLPHDIHVGRHLRPRPRASQRILVIPSRDRLFSARRARRTQRLKLAHDRRCHRYAAPSLRRRHQTRVEQRETSPLVGKRGITFVRRRLSPFRGHSLCSIGAKVLQRHKRAAVIFFQRGFNLGGRPTLFVDHSQLVQLDTLQQGI